MWAMALGLDLDKEKVEPGVKYMLYMYIHRCEVCRFMVVHSM